MPRQFVTWIVFLVCLRPAIAADALNIRVVEGQGAINNIRTRMARAPVVELRDEQGNPIAGASVTFQTPATGPSAEFGAEHLLVTQTDSEGRATGLGLVPNELAGPFEIRVTASFSAKTASATIKQINASPSESRSSKKALWIALGAGAVAGGVLAAAHGHSGAATPPAPASTSATLVAGPTSFGPPH
jgi:hypothetical protein